MLANEIGHYEVEQLCASVNQERNSIVNQAANQLGYKRLKGTKLAETLAALEILPLNFADVRRYMDSKKIIRPSRSSLIYGVISGLLAWAAVHLCLVIHDSTELPNVMYFFGALLSSAGATGFGIATIAHFRAWDWHSKRIDKYKGSIPEHVIRRALEVKAKLPDAEFYVSYLAADSLLHPDPFLWVELGAEWYWLDVWEEKFSA